ncbi:MAG TPA: bifunctional phosphoribosyl-AMP cyclohydrolase/phosphoribosyl-ATP diphosphatase HisIE [Steroidobacteraceae bacterium]|nr:bifunctional phosphoribosyl-AMP cyclohydrolase/phosphoribosyl-ATP diphosphatase HisIE [Steroidobacteraceae bacterium]
MSGSTRIEHDAQLAARLDWDKGGGLLPAIVQHALTGSVLMLGYMNREALAATLERGRAVFYSRTRKRLWEKGETSGHTLTVQAIRTDCDADTLLISALPNGPVCHNGTASCFGDAPLAAAEQLSFLVTLQQIIEQRIGAPTAPTAATVSAPSSYTARLHAAGVRRMAQKVGEEGVEVALAALGTSDAELIGESADLLFHLLVLLRARSLSLERVVAELQQRHTARAAAPDQSA